MEESMICPIYDEAGNRLTECDETRGWVEWTNGAQDENGNWIQSGIYHPYSEEELAAIEAEREAAYRSTPEYRIAELEAALELLLSGVTE